MADFFDEDGTPMVNTNIGVMPEQEYLDIRAMQYGFSSYAELKEQGFSIDSEV